VAVVNETFARYFFKDGDPIGRRFGFGRIKDGMGLDITIVGLVRDGKIASLKEEAKRYVYFPYGQQTSLGQMTYYVRAGAATDVLASRLRKIVSSVDASLPVTNLKTMEAQIGESLLVERLVAALSAAFGLLATLLAGLGLYGVMSYAVTLRTREIGIRMALGAEGSQVLRLVLHEVSLLTAVGVAVGLPGGYGLGRIIESQLFGLTARDPFTFAVATATLLTAALLAGYIPAARAARVDPMVALRYE
jgi:putative ABC transport system permease protein